jgi:hypothetical protein
MNKRTYFLMGAAILTAAIVTTVVIGGNDAKSFGDSGLSTVSTADYQVSYPVQLPTGFVTPTGIASSNDGVWFFAQGGNSGSPEEAVFHYVASTQTLKSFSVAISNASFQAGGLTPMAVSTRNGVWLGLNDNLIEISASNGSQTDVTLPPVPFGGPGLPTLPGTDPGATSPIEAIGFDASGNIVVIRMFATALQIVNPTTLAVEELALPTGTAIAGMGNSDFTGSPDGGVLAFALYSSSGVHELGQLSSGAWSVSDGPCPAYAVSYSNGSFTAKGPSCIESGSVGNSPGPVTMTSVTGPDIAPGPGCAIQLASGKTFVCLGSGVAVLGGGTESEIQSLGEVSVVAPIGVPGQGVSSQVSRNMEIEPTLTSSTVSGSIWFIPSAGSPSIGVIQG